MTGGVNEISSWNLTFFIKRNTSCGDKGASLCGSNAMLSQSFVPCCPSFPNLEILFVRVLDDQTCKDRHKSVDALETVVTRECAKLNTVQVKMCASHSGTKLTSQLRLKVGILNKKCS